MSNPKWPPGQLDGILSLAQAQGAAVAASPDGEASALRYALHRRARKRGLAGRFGIAVLSENTLRVTLLTEHRVEIISTKESEA